MKKNKQLKSLFLIFSFILINNSQALKFRCWSSSTITSANYYEINLTFQNIGSEEVYLDNIDLRHHIHDSDILLDNDSTKEIVYSPNKGGYLNLQSIESPEHERGFKWELNFTGKRYDLLIHKYPEPGVMVMLVCRIDQDEDGYGISFKNKAELLKMKKNTTSKNSDSRKYNIRIS